MTIEKECDQNHDGGVSSSSSLRMIGSSAVLDCGTVVFNAGSAFFFVFMAASFFFMLGSEAFEALVDLLSFFIILPVVPLGFFADSEEAFDTAFGFALDEAG